MIFAAKNPPSLRFKWVFARKKILSLISEGPSTPIVWKPEPQKLVVSKYLFISDMPCKKTNVVRFVESASRDNLEVK